MEREGRTRMKKKQKERYEVEGDAKQVRSGQISSEKEKEKYFKVTQGKPKPGKEKGLRSGAIGSGWAH